MTNFSKWDKEFRSQNLYAFNKSPNGVLWLKVRALCRCKQMRQFVKDNKISLLATKKHEQNMEIFEIMENEPCAMSLLDNFLRNQEHEWYRSLKIDEEQLKNDLYKVHHYMWGGDRNNSLDKHLVSRYVKVISRYDELLSKQPEIAENAWNYVQTSWYNNWTSYLIESLFKRHKRVVSAVGEIKSVDFFIDDFPIDLKVTFFPNQYLSEKLKVKLRKREITWLKDKARANGIAFDREQTEAQQMYTIVEKLSELGLCDILHELSSKRKEVIDEARANPAELMAWLYANQGEMRFGAENRLYLILADSKNISDSWKMKRAFSLIEPSVNQYLDGFSDNSLKEINFLFNGNRYKSLCDAIFVVK